MKVSSSTLPFLFAAVLGTALLGGCDRRSPTTDQPGAGGMPASGAPGNLPSSMMPGSSMPPATPGATATPGSPPPEPGK